MRTIRGQMLTYLLLGAIALFGILFLFSAFELNQLPELTKSQYQEIVMARSEEIAKELKGFKEHIELAAKSHILKSMDLKKIKAYLPEFIIEDKHRSMTIGYPDGFAWSTLEQEFDISWQEQYQGIFLEGKDLVISQPFFSPYVLETDRPAIIITKSIKKDGETVGLVNALMSIGFLDNVIKKMDLKKGAYGWIINKEGMIVAHPDSDLPVKKNLRNFITDENIVAEILTTKNGIVNHLDENEQRMLIFFNEINESPDWIFLLSISENAIYGGVNEVKNTILAAILVGFFFLTGFAFVYSENLSKPILDLIRVFERAANGNLNERADEEVKNELGLAAKSFNTMLGRIKDLTYRDTVTGLYNYNGFVLELPHRLKRIEKEEFFGAIAIISIEDFKRINSVYGFEFGDEVLKVFADRLKTCLKGKEIVARFLGDEFILFLIEPNTLAMKERIKNLWSICSGGVKIGSNQIMLKVSIGASFLLTSEDKIEEKIYEANIAKSVLEKKGGKRYRFYDFELEELIKEEQKLEDALYQAIEKNELRLVYQPIVELVSGKNVKVEALLRWSHPQYGNISPLVLVRIAEKNGFITEIGKWVLKEACKQNKNWQLAGYEPIVISVNVSVIQFEQTNFLETVKNILRETGLEPKYLQLEITEGIAMGSEDKALQKIKELRKLGISVAIDDFGTGYSSLAYFMHFPIDTLKIDRSFINNMLEDENSKTIIKAIIKMAKTLKIETVAEGVETQAQLNYLSENNCDQIQGYFISKPVDAKEIKDLLELRQNNIS